MKRFGRGLLAGALMFSMTVGTVMISADASAQSDASRRRQEKKNEWRNIGIGSGVIALWGLLKNDSTLTFAGTAGALYSAYRYEQDRKSQSKIDRARAAMFSKTSFYRDGVKYTRHTKWKNGKKYYYFAKTKSKSRNH